MESHRDFVPAQHTIFALYHVEELNEAALILFRVGPHSEPSPADIEIARVNFSRLIPLTAEQVASFW